MADLDYLLGKFPDASPERDGWVASCPSHTDSHPSLRIALGSGGGLLLKCRAGCKTEDVLSAAGLTWSEIAEVHGVAPEMRRATSADVAPSVADIAAMAHRLDGYRAAYTGSDSAKYAEERFGVGPDLAEALGLGHAEDIGTRLVVPFRTSDGVSCGFQARDVTGTAGVRWYGPANPVGASWSKTGIFLSGTGWDEVIVTEGPGDALTACAAGYDAVAVRGASLAMRSDVAEAIHRFAAGRSIVVFGDADDSGRRFARELAAGLARLGASATVAEPAKGGDVTAWREADPAGFQTAFVSAVRDAVKATTSSLMTRLDAFDDEDMTDLGVARRLRSMIESVGSGVHFTTEAGFFLLDHGVWRQDKAQMIRTYAQDCATQIWDEVREIVEEFERFAQSGATPAQVRAVEKQVGAVQSFARKSSSTRGIDSMIRELSALKDVSLTLSDFDAHPHLLAVNNGVVNLRTGELGDHDPALLLTRRVPIDFDPAAQADRWERFLVEVFPSRPEMPAYIRRLIGYGITGETSEQCFVVHYGKGANGKSIFTDTLTEVFRELTVTTPFSTFEHRPSGGIPNDLAALKGARLVMAAEGEQGKPMAESVLKRVTGHDMISARFMRQEFFEFRPTFLLMLASNHKPNFRGQDEGLWRRVKLIDWQRFFAPHERDHYLGETLLKEAQGILAWAVRGSVEWYADGMQDPAVVRNATREYREMSNPLAGFLPGVFEFSENETTLGEVMWREYGDWVEAEALPAKERMTRRGFFGTLEGQGLVKRRHGAGVAFVGVRRATRADEAPLAHVPGKDKRGF